jgi:predicted ATP-grasp superfamily ATP-dependent carboligase
VNVEMPHPLLLVSCSGRMLARSAARAGLRPFVLDLFADQDTRDVAAHCEAVAPGRIGFDPDGLVRAADRLAPPGRGFSLVYGSGLDVDSGLLESLTRGRTVYGNSPETLSVLKTPESFFDLLGKLDIPHPEISRVPPPDPHRWLIKSGCSEGGKQVRLAAEIEPGPRDYYQRRLPGSALSALFLADGENALIIGFNTLWTASHDRGRPFLFAGAVNRAGLSRRQRGQVQAYVARLTREVSLKGLNSLDFMVDGEVCRVLEINPRPSATLALYDGDFAEGLLACHIGACRGRLGAVGTAGAIVRAFRVLFALRDIDLPDAFVWPDWCADRPVAGSSVARGQPICTIEAEGLAVRAVSASIKMREQELSRRLYSSGVRIEQV